MCCCVACYDLSIETLIDVLVCFDRKQDISGVPSVKRRKLQPKSDAVKAGKRNNRNRVEIEYEVETEPKQRERIHK